MKLSPRDAARFFARPDPGIAGVLIYGADPMRVALKRQELIRSLIGAEGEGEMRLTRIAAADLRRDPASLQDATKAQGFFPGDRAVLVEDAGDGLAPVIAAALDDWEQGDATVVVTAGILAARSALRKRFEAGKQTIAAAVYDDPPGRDEVETMLRTAGLTEVPNAAMQVLLALSRSLDPGDYRQTIEKIALYKRGDPDPLTEDEIAALAPASAEAALDDVLHAVAEARTGEIGPVLRRLEAQGVTPVSLCIGASRHFRTLHAAAADPGGAAAGIGKVRPPVFGPRRDRMARQASTWGADRLERALAILIDTDLALRSSRPVPAMAMMERALIRLAMLGRR